MYHLAYFLITKTKPTYFGRVTVPMLWDTKEETIVNNELAEILRIFNTAFSVCLRFLNSILMCWT